LPASERSISPQSGQDHLFGIDLRQVHRNRQGVDQLGDKGRQQQQQRHHQPQIEGRQQPARFEQGLFQYRLEQVALMHACPSTAEPVP